ncbi:S-protein homolog 2-like [Hibiscus syriacus]|uniref:S-protein homolog 2-like n=1 Tax=Hibiscus syriacus TaxID=106335 RepID=UPI00192467BF|nr:S-protein homolog 2-like [Hibiscus syriacus]
MNPWAIRRVWLLSVMLVFVVGIEAFWNTKLKVVIYNDLEDKKDLTIHCKSKDDDLGVHVLSYRESYDFQFKPRFLWRTLFFCRMTWSGKSHWFDIYRGDRDGGIGWGCHESDDCVWNDLRPR